MRKLIILVFLAYSFIYASEKLSASFNLTELENRQNTFYSLQNVNCETSVCYIQIKDGNKLTVRIEKPLDKIAEVTLRFPDQTSVKKAGNIGDSYIELTIEKIESKHNGAYQLAFIVGDQQVNKPSFGIFALFVYSSQPVVNLITIKHDENELANGDKIESGCWIFASTLDAISPIDTTSLCVIEPDNDYECSNNNFIDFRINEKGLYRIISWNKNSVKSEFIIYGV